MNFLQHLTNFYATENVMLAILIAAGSAFAIGHLLDRVLGGMSFGAIGNALLILMSMVIAVAVGPERTYFIDSDGATRLAILASAVATGLMLALGALKSYLLQAHH